MIVLVDMVTMKPLFIFVNSLGFSYAFKHIGGYSFVLNVFLLFPKWAVLYDVLRLDFLLSVSRSFHMKVITFLFTFPITIYPPYALFHFHPSPPHNQPHCCPCPCVLFLFLFSFFTQCLHTPSSPPH